jgi:hypothetical protein
MKVRLSVHITGPTLTAAIIGITDTAERLDNFADDLHHILNIPIELDLFVSVEKDED